MIHNAVEPGLYKTEYGDLVLVEADRPNWDGTVPVRHVTDGAIIRWQPHLLTLVRDAGAEDELRQTAERYAAALAAFDKQRKDIPEPIGDVVIVRVTDENGSVQTYFGHEGRSPSRRSSMASDRKRDQAEEDDMDLNDGCLCEQPYCEHETKRRPQPKPKKARKAERRQRELAERDAWDITDILGQETWWRTRDEGWVKVKKMTTAHLAYTMAHLLRNARQIVSHEELAAHRSGLLSVVDPSDGVFAAQSHAEGLLQDMATDPLAWVANSPLFQAMRAEFDERMCRYGGGRWEAP